MRQKGFAPIIILFIIIVLGAIGYFAYSKGYIKQLIGNNIGQTHTTPTPYPTNTPTPNPTATPTPGATAYKTYTNTKEKIYLTFPVDFVYNITSPDFIPPNDLPTLIAVFRKKGFSDSQAQYSQVANFAISKSSDITNCYVVEGKTLDLDKTLNGTVFKTGTITGGATGHTVSASVYRAVVNGSCYELESSIQTSTGSGEGLSALQGLINSDKQNLQSGFDQILSTFTFTGNNQTKVNCKNPRAEVCPMLCIQPPPYICGSDGKNYCSTCQACGNPNVEWYQMSTAPCSGSAPL